MPSSESNLADHSGSILQSHKGYDPRVIFFYFVVAALLLILAGGLAYQQLFKTDTYNERVEALLSALLDDAGVRIPGHRRQALADKALAEGIALPAATLDPLLALAGA